MTRLRVLAVSTMYPNPRQPVFGVFVARRLAALAEHHDVTVVCPVPYFPLAGLLPRYAHRGEIPAEATVAGLPVVYRRFLSVPRFFKAADGAFMGLSLLLWCRGAGRTFDVVDAHLAYPDGEGARIAAAGLGVPYAVTVRGHDLNDTPRHPARRRIIRNVLSRAGRVTAVAEALARRAVELGADPARTVTLPNGIDRELFRPHDRRAARQKLGLPPEATIILSVGHLVERKGVHLVTEALGLLVREGRVPPDVLYVAVGGPGEEGDYTAVIAAAVEREGLSAHVRLAGERPPEELPLWYSAADVMCLASAKEGRANVLSECLACGTPVVATAVWGTPEVIDSPDLGILVERSPRSIADGLAAAVAKRWDRAAVASRPVADWPSVGADAARYLTALVSDRAR